MKTILLNVLLLLCIGQSTFAQPCGCKSPNLYGVEYPSTPSSTNQPSISNMPTFIPLSALSIGNTIHLYFPSGPCNNTVSNPCYGSYKAIINGQTFSSSGGVSGNMHLHIPLNALSSGLNTIIVKGYCGTTTCTLNPINVNVIASGQSTANITLSKECCKGPISGPQQTSSYTGEVKFKMGGTASPGVQLKIIGSGISTVIPFVASTGIGDGYTGCYNKSLTITVLDALGSPISGATINGSTNPFIYIRSNKKFNLECENKLGPSKKTDVRANIPYDPTDDVDVTGDHDLHERSNYIGHVTLLRYTQLYLGYGLLNMACVPEEKPNTKQVTYSFTGNVFVPFIRSKKGWDGTVQGSRTFGLNAGIQYMQTNYEYDISKFKPYNIYGQSEAPTVKRGSPTGPHGGAFKLEAGPQLNINIKKLSFSPIVDAGYINMTENAYSVIQTTEINGASETFTLFNQAEINTKGLTLSPKLRLAYTFGRIGIWAEGHYTIGGSSKIETSYLSPNGQSDTSGFYKFDLVKEGTMNSQTTKTKYCSMGVNAGIMISLGKRK